MAITSAICNSYKQEAMEGVHESGDVYKIALYTSAATLNKSTTAYSATNEVTGTGYSSGGTTLAGIAFGLSTDTAYIDWNDPAWGPGATITARGALIYNSSQGNKAVATIDFGADYTCTNGTLTIQLPAAGASAIIRIA